MSNVMLNCLVDWLIFMCLSHVEININCQLNCHNTCQKQEMVSNMIEYDSDEWIPRVFGSLSETSSKPSWCLRHINNR